MTLPPIPQLNLSTNPIANSMQHIINRQNPHFLRIIIPTQRHTPTDNAPMQIQLIQPLENRLPTDLLWQHWYALREEAEAANAARVGDASDFLAGGEAGQIGDGPPADAGCVTEGEGRVDISNQVVVPAEECCGHSFTRCFFLFC